MEHPVVGTSRPPARAALGAALVLALAGLAVPVQARPPACGSAPGTRFVTDAGGIVRGDVSRRELALIFTGGDFADGGPHIRAVLRDKGVRAGFFFTGDFYRAPDKAALVRGLAADGHYLGPHSDRHLLYCGWEDRSRTLVTREEFERDLLANYAVMEDFGVRRVDAPYFIPPYEWYNEDIVSWAGQMGVHVFNFTPGTSSNADYMTPDMPGYLPSSVLYDRILAYEAEDPNGLNGFILLIHIGTDPKRTDKLYARLGELIDALRGRGYAFVRIDDLLGAPGIAASTLDLGDELADLGLVGADLE